MNILKLLPFLLLCLYLSGCIKDMSSDQKAIIENSKRFNREYGDGFHLKNRRIESLHVSNLTISNATWEKVEILNSSVKESQFRNMVFSDVSFTGNDIFSNSFKDCRFNNCTFIQSEFDSSQFISCEFENPTFLTSRFRNSTWKSTNITNPTSGGTDFNYSDFDSCAITGGKFIDNVRFLSSSFRNCRFNDIQMDRSHFNSARLKNCEFSALTGDVLMLLHTEIEKVTLNNCSLKGFNCAGSEGSDLTLIDVKSLESLILGSSVITNLRIRNSSSLYLLGMDQSTFKECLIENSTFGYAAFMESSLESMRFKNVTFTDEVDFTKAKFSDVDFSGVSHESTEPLIFSNTVYEGNPPF